MFPSQISQNFPKFSFFYSVYYDPNEFLPSCYSKKVIDWFEGTGTVIGFKRNRIFILSSIHCIPKPNYSFYAKGAITHHKQIPVTLVINHFIMENNGIDVAVFSCDMKYFDPTMLQNLQHLKWVDSLNYRIGSPLWLIHYPTSINNAESNMETPVIESTHRLDHDCFPIVSTGNILSHDNIAYTIDSTIVATAGSSGGLIIDENYHIIGVHDSQHDDNPDHIPVSTHRLVKELREYFHLNKQLSHLLE